MLFAYLGHIDICNTDDGLIKNYHYYKKKKPFGGTMKTVYRAVKGLSMDFASQMLPENA